MPAVQTINTRYLDKAKLHNLLQTLFPDGGYECEVGIVSFPSTSWAYWHSILVQNQYRTDGNTP